ncbi:MAG: LacI family DNA-binding transcriptional regulator [Rudaea sp.]
MHVTIKDVARLAGCSTKTVSRVINNQAEISDDTRARVQAAIAELGYRPNFLARSLVNRRTNTVAVVAWGIDLFGPSRTVVGIEHQADVLGYSLMLNLRCNPTDNEVDAVLELLAGRRVDGIIWAVPEVCENRKWVRPGRLESLPPMVLLSMAPRPGLPVVAVNNLAGAMQAVQHLVNCGRNKIGIITGPLTWWEARERLAGWKQVLVRARLPSSTELVVEGDWSAASGERGMRALLAQERRLDAVFACNDQMALGALGVLRASGRGIPEDMAIVGFDDIPEAAYFNPPLSTVHQPLDELGRAAVRRLHGLIEAQREGRLPTEAGATLLDPRLVVRSSSS